MIDCKCLALLKAFFQITAHTSMLQITGLEPTLAHPLGSKYIQEGIGIQNNGNKTYLSCLLRVVVPHVQPRHSQLQHGILLGTRGLLDDAIGESLQAMKPSMIVISEIKVNESIC